MPQVRYLGMVVGELADGARSDARLGQYAQMTEPMPVGTALELDGATYFVTRVDEGAGVGCWLWPDGAARAALDDGPTAPERVISFDAEPSSGVSSMAIRAVVDGPSPERAASEPPAPDGSAAAAADEARAVPETIEPAPSVDEPGPGGKKRKRRAKTVMGR